MSVDIPHVAIALGDVSPDEEDVIEILVHLGATKEVSSFELVLQNWEGKYSPNGAYPILVGELGGIGIGRGANAPAIISLKIEGIKYENPSSVEKYLRVTGRCWGEALFRRVVTKSYENKKGEFIVKDLIDNCTGGLGHVRGAVELIEDTDTTYTLLEYENTPVWDILKYIASSADKAGVIGYDFRIAPDGNFEFFPINSKSASVSVLEKLEVAEYSKDISRIRNKITVYGFADRKEPVDGDLWTDSLTGWVSHNGDLSLDGADKKVGSFSIRDLSHSGYSSINRTVTSMKIDEGAKLMFWFAALAVNVTDVYVRLCTDDSNFFEADIPKGEIGFDDFDFKTLTCGKGFQYDAISNPNGIWRKIGTPSWYTITKIWFYVTATSAIDTHVDGLFFSGLRFRYTAEDEDSQDAYGLRELTETDEELWSDHECELRAKALLAYLKDPAEYLKASSTIIDYALTPLLAADKVHVHLPNEGIDADFRTDSMTYHVDSETQTLELTFELGKIPPMLADYLYGLRRFTVNVESLARTKLGKKGIPSGAGGGADSAFYHHTRHEVGDSSGVKWATAEAGGMDPLTGWIAPSHIGPFNDVATTIYFRTKNKAGNAVRDHIFAPTDDTHGILGGEQANWLEVWSKYFFLPLGGQFRIRKVGDTQPLMLIDENGMYIGPGGSVAADVYFNRSGTNTAYLKATLGLNLDAHLIAYIDDTYDVGKSSKKWRDLYLSGKLMAIDSIACHLIPDWDDTKALGSTDKRWSAIHAVWSNFSYLNMGGVEVLKADRYLYNVTADASIIQYGTFGLDRIPNTLTGKDADKLDGYHASDLIALIGDADTLDGYDSSDFEKVANKGAAGGYCPLNGYGLVDRSYIGGYNGDIDVAKVGGGTRTLHFQYGVCTGYTDS